MIHKLKPEVTRDDKFARLAWARVLKGNVEGADEGKVPATDRVAAGSLPASRHALELAQDTD